MGYTELLLFLREHYYRETSELLQSGDIAVFGDTIHWWPVSECQPYRCHFFGEELERVERRAEAGFIRVHDMPTPQENMLRTEHGTIKPGEYLVHPYHGVGIFEYLVTRVTEGGERTFVSLEYAGNDRLLFPFDKQGELMPYVGSRHPRLTRLNSKVWLKTRERVQKDLIKVARELLKIYANRQLAERPQIGLSEEWEKEVRKSAGFRLTEDQERALGEIQHDLALSPHPMDRLVCGDVGFGKTEVALHAAAQIVQAGMQVAFIAPTTVLAEQHYLSTQRRLRGLPINVVALSRLSGNNKETLAAIERGEADIVVGTHSVLASQVHLKRLGLLIVDEEQKFGVAQKERLKELRPQIDILSMSATPIPRTLSMSMSGLRGLSLLRTPPGGRKPVQTIIEPFTTSTLRDALAAEMERDGQAYVVYNRVQPLGQVLLKVEEELREAGFEPVPEGSERGGRRRIVAMAHGQMDEHRLQTTMRRFMDGEIDVLVASSIVEHGLDSERANTLIVLHSEWFGLSDLYQLRGRVGRRRTQAFAYFMIGGLDSDRYAREDDRSLLTDVARQRLAALAEADQLGSGWSVALRDLEIRGGGNLLGHEQHGSMESIGLLLYAQLLQEEIGRQAKRAGVPLFRRSGGAD